MTGQEFQQLKDELAQLKIAQENTEGYFDNFAATLNNHMTSYNDKLKTLSKQSVWGFWILFSLTTLAIGGLLTMTGLLLARFLG